MTAYLEVGEVAIVPYPPVTGTPKVYAVAPEHHVSIQFEILLVDSNLGARRVTITEFDLGADQLDDSGPTLQFTEGVVDFVLKQVWAAFGWVLVDNGMLFSGRFGPVTTTAKSDDELATMRLRIELPT